MQMKNKWTFIDILVLCLEIAIPIISIVITCAVPQGRALDSDIKLAIIGGGISYYFHKVTLEPPEQRY